MTKRLLITIVLSAAISGCAAQRVARMIDLPAQPPASYVAWAQETNATIRNSVGINTRGEAFLAYRVAAAAEVDAGRATPALMDAAVRQKMAEVEAADRADGAALMMAGAAISAASYRPPLATPVRLSNPVMCQSTRLGATIQTACY